MGYLMKKELGDSAMKKLTQQKYEMLLARERSILHMVGQKKIRKQEETRKLHEIIEH